MKKRLLSLLLAAAMTLSLLPVTAAAADAATANYSDNNVTWIGTQAEYQKTLDSFFVEGLRRVKVDGKWGIVDATGAFVAPPIYEQIKPEYCVPLDSFTGELVINPGEPMQEIFVDGYTQCTRGGKVGLLNVYGEEVVPAQYYGVGLPVDGICRVSVKEGDRYYLGYWSLELGREILAPNKYVTTAYAAASKGVPVTRRMLDRSALLDLIELSVDKKDVFAPGSERLATEHDFVDGYALVIAGAGTEAQNVTSYKSGSGEILYGTIIDKTGNVVLPGGPYAYRAGTYPQFGPYMIFVEQSKTDYLTSDGLNLGRPFLSGVVGPQGVVIPAQYAGGVRAPIEGKYVGDARMEIIPELGLVITAKDTAPGKENGGKVGVVNFKNETVIPFVHDFNYFVYDQVNKVFYGMGQDGDCIYTSAGKRLNKTAYSILGAGDSSTYQATGSYMRATTRYYKDGESASSYRQGFVDLKTGQEYLSHITDGVDAQSGRYFSDPSSAGLVWLENETGKIGLVDLNGNVILPYQYDKVAESEYWTTGENAVSIVYKGQKQGLVTAKGVELTPCEYDGFDFRNLKGRSSVNYIIAKQGKTVGLISLATGKPVIPTIYDEIGGMGAINESAHYFIGGAEPVKKAGSYLLVDMNGSPLPGTEAAIIYPMSKGLFDTTKKGTFGPDGRVAFPDTLNYSGRKNYVWEDTTLVVKDGKVGYIDVTKLAKTTQPKTPAPRNATAAPSPMNLLVNGQSVSVEAYAINGNNYIKVRDMAYFLNGTRKNFGVTWNGAKGAVELKSNTPYATVAGDMSKGDGAAKPAGRSTSAIYVDGLQRKLTAYAIGGNNFFKLRDVMKVFDVYVGYENGTVTVDTSKGYELTDAEKAGFIPASTETEAPPASQVNKLEVIKSPNLEFYMNGNHTFTTAGFELRYWDDKGVPHTVTDLSEMTFTVEGKVIKDGYVFTSSSMKTGTVGYKGLTAPLRFPVYQGAPVATPDPVPGQSDKQLADGKYTITCLGNNFGLSNGWMVLDSKNPVTLSVKKDGDYYYIYQEGTTKNLYMNVSSTGGQLVVNNSVEKFATKWTITHLGGDTYSVREYAKPEMVVNASGESSKDGTKVIVWKSTATPKNSILTFTPAS